MIFQDPMTALNPVFTVGEQIAEVVKIHENLKGKESIKKSCGNAGNGWGYRENGMESILISFQAE